MNETNRLEAFSDGVMAIAITLLVLDLVVPTRDELSQQGITLGHALAQLWPNFAAYLVSFLVIGVIWVNHHSLFTVIARVDRRLLYANLFLLLAVSIVPFPTRLLSEYLTAGDANAHLSAAVYSATMLLIAIAYTTLFAAATRDAALLEPWVDQPAMRRQTLRFGLGVVVYPVTILLSFVSAPLTLAVHFCIVVYYAFDQTGSTAAGKPPPSEPTVG